MGGAETKGTQVRSDLLDAHQGYPVVTTGASSSGSGGSGGVRSNREDDREKKCKRAGPEANDTIIRKNPNGRGERNNEGTTKWG